MGIVAATAFCLIILSYVTCLECTAGIGSKRWSREMFRQGVGDLAVVIPAGAVTSCAVVALGALAVTIGICGGVFCLCTYAVALAAGCGVHVSIVVAVAAAGSVLRVMGGKSPFSHGTITGIGGFPVCVIVTADTVS